jgi:cytochrome c biogenesis protein
MYIARYGEFLFKIFQTLDFFDMYHSWWFRALLVLLTINIIICSIDRLSKTGKIIFRKQLATDLDRFERMTSRENFDLEKSPDALQPDYETFIKNRYTGYKIEKTETGFALFAEKGRWTRLGVYAVHFSVVLMLLGGLIGSIFGFDGSVTIPEGESRKEIILRNTREKRELDFAIRCDDFNVQFYESGTPDEYRSTVSLLRDGTPLVTRDILVNQPLRYEGINIYQSNYGTATPKEVTLMFTERENEQNHPVETTMGKTIALPDGLGTFTLTNFVNNTRMNLGETFVGVLTTENGETRSIMLPFRYPRFDRMRKDRFVISVADFEKTYYTGLQVTRDPGVGIVYAGFAVLIIGCYVTFFMSHQQVCVAVTAHKTGSRVMIAGNTNRNKYDMNMKIQKLAHTLKRV